MAEGVLITGVHGSGKSSVIAEIAYLLERQGERPRDETTCGRPRLRSGLADPTGPAAGPRSSSYSYDVTVDCPAIAVQPPARLGARSRRGPRASHRSRVSTSDLP
jgi:hypothetical protein